jgi:hypothetical protein
MHHAHLQAATEAGPRLKLKPKLPARPREVRARGGTGKEGRLTAVKIIYPLSNRAWGASSLHARRRAARYGCHNDGVSRLACCTHKAKDHTPQAIHEPHLGHVLRRKAVARSKEGRPAAARKRAEPKGRSCLREPLPLPVD